MRRLPWLLLVLSYTCAAGAPDRIFRDGFEAGSAPPGAIACVSGPSQSAALGALPAGMRELLTCFELRNDLAMTRREVAYGSVPVPRSVNLRDADLARLVVAGPGDLRLPAQFRILSRWGATADADAPARWLQITVPADVAANGTSVFALLRYATAPTAANDASAVSFSDSNGRWTIDTGLARFELDPANPTLFERIAVRDAIGAAAQEVLSYQPGVAGYGPYLRVGDGGGGLLFEAGNAVAGSLQISDARVREVGPVQVVVTMDGRFRSGDTRSSCTAITPSYEGYQWSVEARFNRGSAHVDLYFLLRNACSTGFGPPWTDQAVQVLGFGWGFPLQATTANSATQFYAGNGAVTEIAGAGAQQLRVEQRRGGGNPWRRQARVHRQQAGITLESGERFANPLAGLRNDRVLAAVSMPWMRFREPQSLTVDGDRIQLDAISEPVIVGEGKALWFLGRLSLGATGNAGNAVTRLTLWRDAALGALERGLIPRAADWVNAGDHWPPLAGAGTSAMLAPYLNYMNRHHTQNVSETACTDPANFVGGQWDCAKTYGAQLWPDVQFEEQFGAVVNADPSQNSPYHNYWNSSGAELWEFLRSGDPKWVWDFALPQTWLQAQTAGLNLGDRSDTIRNGFVVNSTGSGDGHWHRGDSGSSDYNYNHGQHLGFALRPNYPLLERFAAQGRTTVDRYSIPRGQQGQRDTFVSAIGIDRGPMQHFEGLANCAEFVPGSGGTACQARLREILNELAQDNLAAGFFCTPDDPGSPTTPCFAGQQFMNNSMFYTFLLRMLLNYGDINHEIDGGSVLRRALIRMPRAYRDFGISLSSGAIVSNGNWAEALQCTRTGDGRDIAGCSPVTIEAGDLFFENRPQTMALLLMSDWLQPDPQLCQQARGALQAMFPDPNGLGPWQGYANGGWWKGASQAVQSVVFGIGLEARCAAR